MRNSSYSSPPGPNKHLAAHTAQPGSLPRILQQTLCPGWGFSRPVPRAGPRDLIVLKHSSYRLIFQCPLSLVCDLHMCWNTVGCSLCSSDQLGISLALRGSGLHSHLSRRHLLSISDILQSFIELLLCIGNNEWENVHAHNEITDQINRCLSTVIYMWLLAGSVLYAFSLAKL